ncbi:hypothetical protein QUF58_13105 [Anaerolineales bacterium HSG24]|nr:hypothetical protein [Anaerolineales bacterium HSG24]
MTNITIWTLESDNDAEAVKYLANKLIEHLDISDTAIRSVGKKAIPRRAKSGRGDILTNSVKNYLKQDDCLIFVIDSDGVMASHQRRQEPNSLINQVEKVLANNNFSGRVYLAPAIQELEAWLLIDCIGICCFFAAKRKIYRQNCREKINSNQKFQRLIGKYQRGNTESIVEAEMGGRGVKEYLVRFSKDVLRTLNPKIKPVNITREKYKEVFSPEIAKCVEINNATLRRNNSLKNFGKLLIRCRNSTQKAIQ